jgi:hypothetical protein
MLKRPDVGGLVSLHAAGRGWVPLSEKLMQFSTKNDSNLKHGDRRLGPRFFFFRDKFRPLLSTVQMNFLDKGHAVDFVQG